MVATKQVRATHSRTPQVKATHAAKVKPNRFQGNMTAETWLHADEWVKVDSSNVKRIRYNYARHILHVEFKNGSWYEYYHVQPATARRMYNAPSMGGFVWKILRKYNYEYKRVR